MNETKKDVLFKKLDRRYEDHLANKERNKEIRENEQEESKDTITKLLERTSDLSENLDQAIVKCDKDHAQEILDDYSQQMKSLDSFFVEKSTLLTPFDAKKVQASIIGIRSKFSDLQDALKPKKKFGFKSDKKKLYQKQEKDHQAVVKDLTDHSKSGFGFTLENCSNQDIEVDCNDVEGKDVLLNNLSNCKITIKSNPITLHATNLSNCVLKCAPVQTSIYLEHCNNCQLSLACQQLRAHSSTNSKIFLHVTSRGIVEDCSKIQVAPYDFTFDGLKEQFAKLGLDSSINHWDELDDFNWLASDQPSPNWCILKQ